MPPKTKPYRKIDNNIDAKDALIKCSRSARNDINAIRRKKGIRMGQDPATPYLQSNLDQWYGYSNISSNNCYLQGNLRTWSAASLFPKSERENNPMYDKKVAEIKFCKSLIKDFCNKKWK